MGVPRQRRRGTWRQGATRGEGGPSCEPAGELQPGASPGGGGVQIAPLGEKGRQIVGRPQLLFSGLFAHVPDSFTCVIQAARDRPALPPRRSGTLPQLRAAPPSASP